MEWNEEISKKAHANWDIKEHGTSFGPGDPFLAMQEARATITTLPWDVKTWRKLSDEAIHCMLVEASMMRDDLDSLIKQLTKALHTTK
jgi:hypothetical protein